MGDQLVSKPHGSLPFCEDLFKSSISLRRQSKERVVEQVQDPESRPFTTATGPLQSTLGAHPQPMLIRDLSDKTPKSDGKHVVSNDLLAILQGVLRKSKVKTVDSRGQQLSSVAAPEDDQDAKRKYEMVFSGLEDILSSLKREYHQRFQGTELTNKVMNAAKRYESFSDGSSNSEIDQGDFDECVKIQRRKKDTSPRKTKGTQEHGAEYGGSVKSVKVVDMSASDINENFLSNIALIRRLSTFKNSKAALKSCAGAPEAQLCSVVDPGRNCRFVDGEYRPDNEAGAGAQNQRVHQLNENDAFDILKNAEAIPIHPAENLAKYYSNDVNVRQTKCAHGPLQKSRASNQQSQAPNIPLAKVDLTLGNIEPQITEFAPQGQQKDPRQEKGSSQRILRRPRVMAASDKENKA